MSDWSFSLRKGRRYNYESDSDSGGEYAVPLARSGAPSINLKTVDTQAEETVEYKESPWTIAKINAVTRKSDPVPPTNPASLVSHTATPSPKTKKLVLKPSDSQKQLTIKTALPKQRGKPTGNQTQSAPLNTRPALKSPLVVANPRTREMLAPLPSIAQSTNESSANQVKPSEPPVLADGKNRNALVLLVSPMKKSPSPVSETYLSSPFRTPRRTPPTLSQNLARSVTPLLAFQSSRLLAPVRAEWNTEDPALPIPPMDRTASSPSIHSQRFRANVHDSLRSSQTLHTMSALPLPATTPARPLNSFVSSLIVDTLSNQKQLALPRMNPEPFLDAGPIAWQSSSTPQPTHEYAAAPYDLKIGLDSPDRNEVLRGGRNGPQTNSQRRPQQYVDRNVAGDHAYTPRSNIPIPIPTHMTKRRIPSPSSSPPASPLPPASKRHKPLSSLPLPSNIRRKPPRRANLDRDDEESLIWSTLPNQKKRISTKGVKAGITRTARFTLPIDTTTALSGSTSTATTIETGTGNENGKKFSYRPPPKKVLTTGAQDRTSSSTDTSIGDGTPTKSASVSVASGWKLMVYRPEAMVDLKRSRER